MEKGLAFWIVWLLCLVLSGFLYGPTWSSNYTASNAALATVKAEMAVLTANLVASRAEAAAVKAATAAAKAGIAADNASVASNKLDNMGIKMDTISYEITNRLSQLLESVRSASLAEGIKQESDRRDGIKFMQEDKTDP